MGNTKTTKMDDRVSLYLLGDFRICHQKQKVDSKQLRLRKARDIVKLLAINSQHFMLREQLMEILWPEKEPKAASHNLNNSLYHIKKILSQVGIDPVLLIQTDELKIQLCQEPFPWIDIDAFEEAAKIAHQTRNTFDYQIALDLYKGYLLPENIYDEWSYLKRENLKNIYHSILRDLAKTYESNQEYLKAIEYHQRLIEEEPTQEDSHISLMRLHALIGESYQALSQFNQMKQILQTELDVEPNPESFRLYREIKSGIYPESHPQLIADSTSPFLPIRDSHKILPRQLTTFIGREKEIADVINLVQKKALVTLLGPGGIGKTRLALEVAKTIQARYPGDIYLVDLTDVYSPEYITSAIANAIEVIDSTGTNLLERVMVALSGKHCLLILDNCEYLIQSCAILIKELLSGCDQLTILVTSRIVLGLSGEYRYEVPPLDFPDPEIIYEYEQLEEFSAIQLLIDRAQQFFRSFKLTNEYIKEIILICQKLEGNPLGIELTASRLKTHKPSELLQMMDNTFQLVKRYDPTSPLHHQSLWESINFSFQLLTMPEKIFFRRLSVFTGGWTLEAAEAICSTPERSLKSDISHTVIPLEIPVVDLLTQLIDQSLIQVQSTPNLPNRYYMLSTIHMFAKEKLMESGEEAIICQSHHEWFVDWVETGYANFYSSQIKDWLDALEAEIENIRKAREWAHTQGKLSETSLRLAGSLHLYWLARGSAAEGDHWLREGLAIDTIPQRLELAYARACYTTVKIWNIIYLGISIEKHRLLEISQNIFRKLGKKYEWELVLALSMNQVDEKVEFAKQFFLADYVKMLDEGEYIARKMGSEGWICLGKILIGRACVARITQDWQGICHLMDEAWSLYQSVGYTFDLVPLFHLASARIELGQLDLAQRNLEEVSELSLRNKNLSMVCIIGKMLGSLHLMKGELNQFMETWKKAWIQALNWGEPGWAGALIIVRVIFYLRDLYLKKVEFNQLIFNEVMGLCIPGYQYFQNAVNYWFAEYDKYLNEYESIPTRQKLLEMFVREFNELNILSKRNLFDVEDLTRFTKAILDSYEPGELEAIFRKGRNIPIRKASTQIFELLGLV